MDPLFTRITPFVDYLSTERFFKRYTGQALSARVGNLLDVPHSVATKTTWYHASADVRARLLSKISDTLDFLGGRNEGYPKAELGMIEGFLINMPRLNGTRWTLMSQKYFNDLASLEMHLQSAARIGDVAGMQNALSETGIARYLENIKIKGVEWSRLQSVDEFRGGTAFYAHLFALIGIAIIDHELRCVIWPDNTPMLMFAPLLPQYRLSKEGGVKGDPVRPERRFLDIFYQTMTNTSAPPTNEQLFPYDTESMVKKIQRGTISDADCYALMKSWPSQDTSEPWKDLDDYEYDLRYEKGSILFAAYFFSSKAFSLLLDLTRRDYRKRTISEMQQNYYTVWKGVSTLNPCFLGGACGWDNSRLERLIRDEIQFT